MMRDMRDLCFFFCGVKFERFDCSKFVPLAHKNLHKNIHHVSNARSSIYIIHIHNGIITGRRRERRL